MKNYFSDYKITKKYMVMKKKISFFPRSFRVRDISRMDEIKSTVHVSPTADPEGLNNQAMPDIKK